jgi:alkylation response protein AidB-like acyl-CoA dehydrogenase
MIDWNSMSSEEFRAEVRAFYQEHYPPALRDIWRYLEWHEMSEWHAKLYAKGWAAPAWPKEYGGMGLAPDKLLIFHEERLDVSRGQDFGGIVMLGPMLIEFGTEQQKCDLLPKILSCEHRWAQGYSEPGSGSDLASLRTEALLDGDEFVVNGQKIWTSWAMSCTHIFALVRTDKSVKKQHGISMLLMDLKTPGVTVRGITNLTGRKGFCEIFFENVRVPRANLVGTMNKGWSISKSAISHERLLVGNPKHCLFALERLTAIGRAHGLFEYADFRDRYTRLRLDVEDLNATYQRYCDILRTTGHVPESVSMLKIWATETVQRLTEAMVDAAGPQGACAGPLEYADMPIAILEIYYVARPTTIGGGSSEVQRNILSKRVLNLPV